MERFEIQHRKATTSAHPRIFSNVVETSHTLKAESDVENRSSVKNENVGVVGGIYACVSHVMKCFSYRYLRRMVSVALFERTHRGSIQTYPYL